ncbi:MAG: hypothetical protein KGM98_10005 [Bacteroidota bacterium]|nr:hypothetical protein [Bacteroidota bacterium]
MFIGHFGVGLGAKKAAPKISLGTLFLAAQFLDLLWPLFILLGWEHVSIQPGITKMTPLNFTDYPYSHSLLFACLWGLVIGGIYYLIKRNKKGAVVLAICVLSHWVLDLIVHRPDLPLYPGGSTYLGWGLWNYPVIEVIVEGSIFILGIIFYLKNTSAKNKIGIYAFWILIILLALFYVSNLSGNPPASVNQIAWMGMSQWIIIFWGYWIDANRTLRSKTEY